MRWFIFFVSVTCFAGASFAASAAGRDERFLTTDVIENTALLAWMRSFESGCAEDNFSWDALIERARKLTTLSCEVRKEIDCIRVEPFVGGSDEVVCESEACMQELFEKDMKMCVMQGSDLPERPTYLSYFQKYYACLNNKESISGRESVRDEHVKSCLTMAAQSFFKALSEHGDRTYFFKSSRKRVTALVDFFCEKLAANFLASVSVLAPYLEKGLGEGSADRAFLGKRAVMAIKAKERADIL